MLCRLASCYTGLVSFRTALMAFGEGNHWQKATKKEAKGEKSGGMFCQFRKKLYLCTAIQRKGIGDIHRKVDLT